jgi:hypothetical protein
MPLGIFDMYFIKVYVFSTYVFDPMGELLM